MRDHEEMLCDNYCIVNKMEDKRFIFHSSEIFDVALQMTQAVVVWNIHLKIQCIIVPITVIIHVV